MFATTMKAGLIAAMCGGAAAQSARASATISFEASVEVPPTDNSWEGRTTALTSVAASGLVNVGVVTYSSVAGAGSETTGSGDASASGGLGGVHGIAYAGLGSSPTVYVASYKNNADWDGSGDATSLDVSASAGFAATQYLELNEYDAEGEVVVTTKLSSYTWTLDTRKTDDSDKVYYSTFTGTKSSVLADDAETLYVTVAVVDEPAELASGTILTTQAMETVFELHDWPYADPANHVELSIGAATVTAKVTGSEPDGSLVSGSGYQRISASTGADQVYHDFANSVSTSTSVSATLSPNEITITAESQTTADVTSVWLNPALALQMDGAVNGGANHDITVQTVKIPFPAGAAIIVYDPTTGAGEAPGDSDAGGSSDESASVMVAPAGFTALVMMLCSMFW